MAKNRKNKYYGQIIRVIDGDTFEAMIELGFGVVQKFCIRLNGIDAPEKNTDKGRKAKEFVRQLIENKQVIVTDVGTEKYGRSLASVQLMDGTDLTKFLLDKQIGIEYDGRRKRFVSSLSIVN
jgi:endonuclease YncB( thermonuclease family)